MGPVEAATPNYTQGCIGTIKGFTIYLGTRWSTNCQARWKAAHRKCNQPKSQR